MYISKPSWVAYLEIVGSGKFEKDNVWIDRKKSGNKHLKMLHTLPLSPMFHIGGCCHKLHHNEAAYGCPYRIADDTEKENVIWNMKYVMGNTIVSEDFLGKYYNRRRHIQLRKA